jgi:hypothetical protein
MKQKEVGENCISRSFMNCSLLQIIRIIKPRRMRLAGHVAQMERIMHTRV